jgi:hypothetical protein
MIHDSLCTMPPDTMQIFCGGNFCGACWANCCITYCTGLCLLPSVSWFTRMLEGWDVVPPAVRKVVSVSQYFGYPQ